MIIKRATPNDAHDLGAFFVEAWVQAGPGALGFTGATEESIHEIASDGFLNKLLLHPDKQVFTAIYGGKVVGFCSLNRIDHATAELSGIVVLEEASGKGVGTALFEKAKGYALEAGYRRLVVKTEDFNERAIGFYTKLGFDEKTRSTETVNGTTIDLVVMEMTVPNPSGNGV